MPLPFFKYILAGFGSPLYPVQPVRNRRIQLPLLLRCLTFGYEVGEDGEIWRSNLNLSGILGQYRVVALVSILLSAGPACSPEPTPRPNILFAISDDQSYPHASAYGATGIHTPSFDRVAQQGVLFTNAFVASPGCSPSRAALLTGLHTWQLEHAGTHASSFPSRFVVYPDLLEKTGYFVGYTGKGWVPGNSEAGGRQRNPAGPEYNERVLSSVPAGVSDLDYFANFREFLESRPPDQPFCFWFGAQEPHREFSPGSGTRAGKILEDVQVPPFLPDTPKIRSDMLDYFLEIEWFDQNLGMMLDLLKEKDELENTLVVVTSDNGMAFPAAKANLYEYGIHVPMAVSWPDRVPGGRVIDKLVSLVDLTPTFLDAAGVEQDSPPMTGHSFLPLLQGEVGADEALPSRVFAARERHSSSRHRNLGYPSRAIRTEEFLYIRNLAPERWPAGAPQKLEEDGLLGPMHGAYHDIDAAPSLSVLIKDRADPAIAPYFRLAVDKRPAEELFRVLSDPGCLQNLAKDIRYATVKTALSVALKDYLTHTGDPRMGPDGDIFETYPRYLHMRKFPPPK